MLELTQMPKGETVVKDEDAKVVKVRLTVNARAAHKLSRVTRWEKQSEATSLELTGRD
jgi:hypothetical protein